MHMLRKRWECLVHFSSSCPFVSGVTLLSQAVTIKQNTSRTEDRKGNSSNGYLVCVLFKLHRQAPNMKKFKRFTNSNESNQNKAETQVDISRGPRAPRVLIGSTHSTQRGLPKSITLFHPFACC